MTGDGFTGSLWLSLEIASMATLVTIAVAVPLAYGMARRAFAGKSFVEALILVPLVLPPTVVGYLLIMLLGARGWVGHYLNDWFGYSILFRTEGAVLASAVVALPLLYLPAKASFASVDRELEDIARLMGANRLQLFWHVSLPLARRGIGSGVILAFARALGEFGATIMVFGRLPRRLTLPLRIYDEYESGTPENAAVAVAALTVVSLVLIWVYNRRVGEDA
jgi:molybdate transport system permease protein